MAVQAITLNDVVHIYALKHIHKMNEHKLSKSFSNINNQSLGSSSNSSPTFLEIDYVFEGKNNSCVITVLFPLSDTEWNVCERDGKKETKREKVEQLLLSLQQNV